MSRRRRQTRRPRPALKLHCEPLETRWLLSADVRRPRPDQGATPLVHALESLIATRSDATAFAWNLATHPRLADDLGLGALSLALRQDAGFDARHGWASELTFELDTHPHYAAAHHLTGLMTPRTPAPGSAGASSGALPTGHRPGAPPLGPTPPLGSSSAGSHGTTTTTTAGGPVGSPGPGPVGTTPSLTPTSSPKTPPGPVLQDPQSVAVGSTLDVTLPRAMAGSTTPSRPNRCRPT